MKLLSLVFLKLLILGFSIGACRVLSMTFKTFCRSITIKNGRLAEMLIAYKNNWRISTSPKKRNKMSLLGLFSYIVFFPQIIFFAYDLWVYITTGAAEFGSAEETYFAAAWMYYIIAMFVKTAEADKLNKRKIW